MGCSVSVPREREAAGQVAGRHANDGGGRRHHPAERGEEREEAEEERERRGEGAYAYIETQDD